MKEWLYRWLPITFGCHRRTDRSFYIKGEQMPICARCTGELVGMIVALLTCFLYRPSILVTLILMIPMVVDGFTQLLTSYESNNIKRVITGLLFGYAIVMLFVIIAIMSFMYGYNRALQKNI